ncbi:pre-mRNA cleavage and polyadenylation factor I subunit [Suhomyces tanzawaensis NRRL Y-17324]|uniref:Pre-mRNA cleavage and polyadenylation factor I subunit n=1 Tax=Suhomyces tanzawaensis NRRL Y-17324 TaxID=984487 RepID=A0A1E4SR52_9ASCO|nr:pre-mRNA cleavage and polyadenylation factor I subunit [Suhomyces tanzawaensis NRRL Y-17324]ODV81882.1 pre-mRNA cleavage and polyadenylation factor I subunit [Suhomyces tanzawaensis NRRL Y-17324]
MDDQSSSIVEDYAQSLTELTFNSRPIIDNLTTIARENPLAAEGIIDAITKRIYKCIPDHKLFALFLLDSVCKYAGNSYNILVGEDIFHLYSHVFQYSSEQNRKTKLISLFETWKVTKTKGTNFPLFPSEQLEKIETFLNKAGYLRQKSNSPSNDLSVKQLIGDIDRLLPIFQNKMAHSSNQKLHDRFKALTQLKALLGTQAMTQKDLQAVQSQLKTIKEQELGNSAITPVPTPAVTPRATPRATPISTPGKPQQATTSKAEELFQILVNSGLVNVEQAPVPGSRPVYNLVQPKAKFVPSTNQIPSNSTLQEILNSNLSNSISRLVYGKLKFDKLMVVSKQISVNFQDFLNTNNSSDSLELLYDAKSSKCSICAKRFANDLEGSTKKRLHLDWHFRINKKLANSASKVQSRNWYLDDFDWVNFRDDDLLEFSTNTGAIGLDNIKKEDLGINGSGKPSFVQVPPSDTNMNNKCLVCQENIKASYNDELGEWCWFDCIRLPGEGPDSRKIIHVACFNEANKKRGPDGDLNAKVKREKI